MTTPMTKWREKGSLTNNPQPQNKKFEKVVEWEDYTINLKDASWIFFPIISLFAWIIVIFSIISGDGRKVYWREMKMKTNPPTKEKKIRNIEIWDIYWISFLILLIGIIIFKGLKLIGVIK